MEIEIVAFVVKGSAKLTVPTEVMTKKNFDEQKKKNFVTIYNFVIKASLVVVFDIYILADTTLMGKILQKYHKSK